MTYVYNTNQKNMAAHKAPFVCNSCGSIGSCLYYRWIYVAKFADYSYRELLSSSREAINQSAEDMQELDTLISPLILKGQSISHIYMLRKWAVLDALCINI
ncbi:hypothetical protein [Ruminiclostridium papyrosolvens]|uniref:hypothetical protein n=1 Tax=Ruminiclostridium papyrosolvens TaxID=29362 RepID=UPI000685712E|nr:hypothetical protein [Ruminiclostridium papyrosolvens]